MRTLPPKNDQSRSSLATDRSSTFMPKEPKLICARQLAPLPSMLTITPSPNLVCATDSPMRQPPDAPERSFMRAARRLSALGTDGISSQADLREPVLNQLFCCTRAVSHFNDSSGSSS